MSKPFNWLWIASLDLVPAGPADSDLKVAFNLNTLGWEGTWPQDQRPDLDDTIRLPWFTGNKDPRTFDFYSASQDDYEFIPLARDVSQSPSFVKALDPELAQFLKDSADRLPVLAPGLPGELAQIIPLLQANDPAAMSLRKQLFRDADTVRQFQIAKSASDYEKLRVPLAKGFDVLLQSTNVILKDAEINHIKLGQDATQLYKNTHRSQDENVRLNFLLLRDFLRLPDRRYSEINLNIDIPHDSWSGALAGLSQKGYPLAYQLGLAYLLDLDPNVLKEYYGEWLAVVPQFSGYNSSEPKFAEEGRPTVEIHYSDEQDNHKFVLRYQSVPIPTVASDKRIQPFLDAGGVMDSAASMDDWRAYLPLRLGQFMDLSWWFRKVAFTAEYQPKLPNHWKEVDAREAILAMIHDHADIGLRQPPQYRNESGPDRLSGTLAWEAIQALAAPQHDSDLQTIREILTDKLSSENAFDGFLPRRDDWVKYLRASLSSASEPPDSSPPRDTKNAYPSLAKLMDANFNEFVGSPHYKPKEFWESVFRELDLFLQDSEVLISLFSAQWDTLLKRPEMSTLATAFAAAMGQNTTVTMSDMKQPLRDWLTETRIPIYSWYGNGLAGEYWKEHAVDIESDDLPNPSPDRGSVSDASNSGGTQFHHERLIAYRTLHTALEFYCKSLWNKGSSIKPLMFFRPHSVTSNPFDFEKLDKIDGAATGAPQSVLEQMLWDGTEPTADGNTRPATIAGEDEAGLMKSSSMPWRNKSWVDQLLGNAKSRWATTPPALPVPMPSAHNWISQGHHDLYAGVLVLVRRQGKKKRATDLGWCCATLGTVDYVPTMPATSPTPIQEERELRSQEELDVSEMDPAKADSSFEIFPIPYTYNFAVPQTILSYRGRPWGVHLWENASEWHGRHAKASVNNAKSENTGSILPMIRRQLLNTIDGWGLLPGPLYHSDLVYQFLFVPVHKTGVLPALLHATEGDNASRCFRLLKKEMCDKILDDPKYKTSMLEVRRYLRRVPIGQPRLDIEGQLPKIPENVQTICSDILDKSQSLALQTLQKRAREAGTASVGERQNSQASINTPQPPAHCVLLWGENAGPTSEVNFSIRPPATEIENWKIWQMSVLDSMTDISEEDRKTRAVCLADTDFLIKDLHRMSAATHSALPDYDIADFLDDPAVCGFAIRTRDVFPTYKDESDNRGYFEVRPPGQEEFNALKDKSEEYQNAKDEQSYLDTCGKLIKKMVQKRAVSGTSSVTVRITRDPSDSSQNRIYVPPGTIKEVEIIPCVSEADLDQRFGIYGKDDKGERQSVKGHEGISAIPSAALRIWVESVPDPLNNDKDKYVTESEVWNALRLSWRGELSGTTSPEPRLEVGLQLPEEAKTDLSQVLKWCYYSYCDIKIQPWRWRGLPEKHYHELAALLTKGSEERKLSPDLDSATFQLLSKGELASFGERPETDCIPETKKINFVHWYFSRLLEGKPAKEAVVPFALLHQEKGSQEVIPRHYRVQVQVLHRYRGLEGAGAKSAWQGIYSERTYEDLKQKTRFHRITFRGKLAQPLKPPQINVVIPLLESLQSHKADRPGFIALAWEPLSSPFHRLKAQIQWAALELDDDGGTSTRFALPEFGPSPITSGRSFDLSKVSPDQLSVPIDLDGEAFGLTYEREATNPLFARAGFYFNCPNPPFNKDDFLNFMNCDWIAKINFYWQIEPPEVMEDPASALRSNPTADFQVRLLAPFRWLRCKGKADPIDVRELTFAIEDQSSKITFQSLKSGQVVPQPPIYSVNKHSPDDSPVASLIFVAWTLVPDFLGQQRSKLFHSLYLIASNKEPQLIARNQALFPFPIGSNLAKGARLKPEGGNFLLLFSNQRNLNKFLQELEGNVGGNDRDRMEDLEEFLFPKKSNPVFRIDKDASGMIVRISSYINAAS